MPKNKCSFQDLWLKIEKYKGWLRKKDDSTAHCRYCYKDIRIDNMGEPALKSHLTSKKHIERYPARGSIQSCFEPKESVKVTNESESQSGGKENPVSLSNITESFSNSSVLMAEIRWVLNLVCSKYSMNSSSNSGELFSVMFPDSDIAKRFQCGRTKAGYVAHFGLAPYFKNNLLSQLSPCPYYSVSFDESLNNVVQKGQMDFNVRYWDEDFNRIATRYLGSEFMGRSTAGDVLETFLAGVKDLDQAKLLQVASDGPNVNLLFLKNLAEYRKENEYLPLVDIGTCGLHVIHGSLKTGCKKGTDWELQKVLKAMWQLLHDAPSRRAMYENITESLDYPAKFCGHRWVENEGCASKAVCLLEGYRKFMTYLCSLKKSQQPDSSNKSFSCLKTMIYDPLLAAKFFEMIAGKMNSFLRAFQTDSPMVPFMADTIGDLVKDFSSRIILKDVLKKKKSLYDLIQLDLLDKDIRKPSENVDVGFEANKMLEGVKSSTSKLKFKKEAGDFLAHLLSHLVEKSPLKYAIIRHAVCFNPLYMGNHARRSSCENHIKVILQKMVSIGRISGKFAELVKKEYVKFFEVVDQNLQSFSGFDPSKERVDTFFSNLMRSSTAHQNLWEFIKMFLVLYHGQSAIERGFSVNKQLLVENLKPQSLVALRTIEDHMRYSELTPENIKIPSKMIQCAKQAHSCYTSELKKKREEKEKKESSLKRKIVTD